MNVYMDANCLIYLMERDPVWHAKVVARIAAAEAAGDIIVVSDLTRAETLVIAFRTGDSAKEADYQAFFTDTKNTVLPITRAICERSARFRAAYRFLKLPDALHLAAAVENGCGLFLTADARLAGVTEIAVEMLR